MAPEAAVPARTQLALGLAAHRAGELESAAARYVAVLADSPANFEALQLLGALRLQQEAYAEAASWLEKALAVRADAARVHFNLALACLQLDRPERALESLEAALRLRPAYPEALNSRGNALMRLNRADEARASYERSLALRAAHAPTWVNLAAALCALHRFADAADACRQALALDPGSGDARAKLGLALYRDGRYEDAEREFAAAGAAVGFAFLGHFRQRLCDWRGFDEFVTRLAAWRPDDQASVDPFVLFAALDDPALAQQVARRFTARAAPASSHPGPPRPAAPDGRRIRVAYLSSDFHTHATSMLSVGLFEAHDRGAFEILGVSYGRPDGSAFEARVHGAFDRFLDVREDPDAEVAERLRGLGVDIVVDLKGHTAEGRPAILASRPAPVIVSFLGYPGTLGAGYVDYLVADEFIVPPAERAYYDERIAYLPGSYQVNDRCRPLPVTAPGRAALGLPERAFVFCSFNNNFKITPAVFSAWMRLLAAVPGSVLWQLEDNAVAARNLRSEAQGRGIDPARLVFAPRVDIAVHLGRHRHADLFLDTFPCNAHTTASDALWAGLPLVTLAGRSFPARVAGSLLHAAGFGDLVTTSLADYEGLALALARDPARLAAMRARLEATRGSVPLFDTPRYARQLETAYRMMVARAAVGEPPSDLHVPAADATA